MAAFHRNLPQLWAAVFAGEPEYLKHTDMQLLTESVWATELGI